MGSPTGTAHCIFERTTCGVSGQAAEQRARDEGAVLCQPGVCGRICSAAPRSSAWGAIPWQRVLKCHALPTRQWATSAAFSVRRVLWHRGLCACGDEMLATSVQRGDCVALCMFLLALVPARGSGVLLYFLYLSVEAPSFNEPFPVLLSTAAPSALSLSAMQHVYQHMLSTSMLRAGNCAGCMAVPRNTCSLMLPIYIATRRHASTLCSFEHPDAYVAA
jgi:hypothetical protein